MMTETPPAETNLWLIRHPEPEAAASGRCYGSLDLSLSERGIRQAHNIVSALADAPLTAIYSSPRRRCTQAASILGAAKSLPIGILDALRELDFGEFEGRTYDEIEASHPAFYRQWMESPTEVQFPGGESFSQVRARVLQARDDLLIRHRSESIAVFTHGGAIRILIAEALGMPAHNLFRIGQSHSGISRIRYVNNTPIIEQISLSCGLE